MRRRRRSKGGMRHRWCWLHLPDLRLRRDQGTVDSLPAGRFGDDGEQRLTMHITPLNEAEQPGLSGHPQKFLLASRWIRLKQ
jgi:hypothetical protein